MLVFTAGDLENGRRGRDEGRSKGEKEEKSCTRELHESAR